MKYPLASDANRKLDKYERVVVNALKGVYDKRLGSNDSYKIALDIIDKAVYGNAEGKTPYYIKVDFLREILLKSRNWSVEDWESRTRDRFSRAIADSIIWKEDFFDSYLRKHLGDVCSLQINSKREENKDYVCILDLDVNEADEEKILSRLDK